MSTRFRRTGTKWRTNRRVRTGWMKMKIADNRTTLVPIAGTSAFKVDSANQPATEPATNSRSRCTGRRSRR